LVDLEEAEGKAFGLEGEHVTMRHENTSHARRSPDVFTERHRKSTAVHLQSREVQPHSGRLSSILTVGVCESLHVAIRRGERRFAKNQRETLGSRSPATLQSCTQTVTIIEI
jgi:hypothetical protein